MLAALHAEVNVAKLETRRANIEGGLERYNLEIKLVDAAIIIVEEPAVELLPEDLCSLPREGRQW